AVPRHTKQRRCASREQSLPHLFAHLARQWSLSCCVQPLPPSKPRYHHNCQRNHHTSTHISPHHTRLLRRPLPAVVRPWPLASWTCTVTFLHDILSYSEILRKSARELTVRKALSLPKTAR